MRMSTMVVVLRPALRRASMLYKLLLLLILCKLMITWLKLNQQS